jgi:hypothetical protein
MPAQWSLRTTITIPPVRRIVQCPAWNEKPAQLRHRSWLLQTRITLLPKEHIAPSQCLVDDDDGSIDMRLNSEGETLNIPLE